MRVVVVEDQALLRDGLVRLFTDKLHDVVGSLGDTSGLDALVAATEPDLVVLDLRMPPTFTDEGATAARALKADRPGLGVLLLSQHVDSSSVVDLVAEPGFGYLLKDRVFEVDDFMDSLRRVAAGGSALDPEVVATLLGPNRDHDPLTLLTPREREVLALMAEGRNNAGIARRLFLTDRTVETHIASIMNKLGLQETGEEHRRVLAVLTWLGVRRRG
jgi:DNA-binding NarL/FixJ family response regulator